MYNNHQPSPDDLPTKGQLLKSTVVAAITAAIILVTVVLPAEYGIDPTGFGSFVGLLKMGEIKVSLADESAAEIPDEKPLESESIVNQNVAPRQTTGAIPDASKADLRSEEMSITLAPNEGQEIKVTMAKGDSVNYSWWTSGGPANFDAHADSKALKIKYHNYEKGSKERSEGVLEAAFDGNHGWFWRNRTAESMTVTLKISGNFTDIKRM